MRAKVALVAPLLMVAACSGSEGNAPGSPTPAPTASPTPTPTPMPTPTPSPTPTPTPSPSPSPGPTGYMTFIEILTTRLGAGVTLQSACGGFGGGGVPPATLPVSAFGRGLTFRYVLTPQVWAVGGDGLSLGFDGRTVDPANTTEEIAHIGRVDGALVRFSINRPMPGAVALDYARAARVEAPVLGVARDYRCVTGMPTTAADTLAAPSGAFARTVLLGMALLRNGDDVRRYTLAQSVVAISADTAARRVAVTVTLVGTPEGGGTERELGRYGASAAIDPASGAFAAPLTGDDRVVTGTISGRFFGPAAVEVGAAFAAGVAAGGGEPAMTVAGTLFGAR